MYRDQLPEAGDELKEALHVLVTIVRMPERVPTLAALISPARQLALRAIWRTISTDVILHSVLVTELALCAAILPLLHSRAGLEAEQTLAICISMDIAQQVSNISRFSRYIG